MAIKEFEFMHGGVITRLLRKDVPMQLTLIGTDIKDSKAVYKILTDRNSRIILYIKYRSKPEVRKNEDDTWIFNFTLNNLKEIESYKDKEFMAALVCGKDGRLGSSEVCLLDSEYLFSNVDVFASTTQSLTIKLSAGKSFRVYSRVCAQKPMIISKNRIDKIEI